jgi:hypothetical protein
MPLVRRPDQPDRDPDQCKQQGGAIGGQRQPPQMAPAGEQRHAAGDKEQDRQILQHTQKLVQVEIFQSMHAQIPSATFSRPDGPRASAETVYVEGRGLSEAEPLGLLTEGAAGIATIVLAIIALAGTATSSLASIAVIVVGVGLMVQAFNTAAEQSKMPTSGSGALLADFGAGMMIDFLAGGTGIILGILALIGIHPAYLIAAALIVFGAGLMLSGATTVQTRSVATIGAGQVTSYHGSAATAGFEIMAGVAVMVLGILSLIPAVSSAALMLVALIVLGAAMLIVSATFSGAVLRLFTSAQPTGP